MAPLVAEGSFLEWVVVENFPVAECGNQVGARQAEEMASHWEAWASGGLEHPKGWVGMAGMASRDLAALQQVRRAGQEKDPKGMREGNNSRGMKPAGGPFPGPPAIGKGSGGIPPASKVELANVDDTGTTLVERSFEVN